MPPELVKYISFIESQKKNAVAELERAKRSIARCDEKLADPEKYFNYENKKGAKKITRMITGEVKPKKQMVVLRKASLESNEAQNKNNGWDQAIIDVKKIVKKEEKSSDFWE